jgi:hypothetical protein
MLISLRNGTTIVIRRKTRERAVSDIDTENDEDNADLDGEVQSIWTRYVSTLTLFCFVKDLH